MLRTPGTVTGRLPGIGMGLPRIEVVPDRYPDMLVRVPSPGFGWQPRAGDRVMLVRTKAGDIYRVEPASDWEEPQ
jgi:hypothetical protein